MGSGPGLRGKDFSQTYTGGGGAVAELSKVLL